MLNIRKIVVRYMRWVTLIMVVVILFITVFAQILNEQRQAKIMGAARFYQIIQILEENQSELAEIENEYRQTCLRNAEAIAYLLERHPEALESIDELKKIAVFMEVDEIHIFDRTGRIFTGTHPEYYDYTFDSGEQMAFFKPMLEDRSLELFQDIMPNTAEGALRQYSALWSESEKFIVQVGMEPVNVMKTMEKNELSYIFSLLRATDGAELYAIDERSGKIVGSTVLETVGKNLTEVGFDMKQIQEQGDGFHARINGEGFYCVFTRYGRNLIGRVLSNEVLYQTIPAKVAELALCLVLIAFILVRAVDWYMSRYVIDGIHEVNEKLRAITDGNLDEKADVQSSLEFSELSSHINGMVKSLLASTEKISYVLNKTNLHIGVYEYNENMKTVRVTEYVPKVLALDADKSEQLFSDYRLFQKYLDELRANSVPEEESVFFLSGGKERYVKLEEVNWNSDTLGVVMDVTEEIQKRRQLEAERDIDPLTGLYNRRGLDSRLEALFADPEALGYGALIMIDADGLKEINDRYGHETGDVYLKKISFAINSFGLKGCVAARQGGDEFVLFLYHYDNEEELLETIDALEYIQMNSTAHLDNDLSVPLRFSFGYSLTKGQSDYQRLLKTADERMYKSKRERKRAAGKLDDRIVYGGTDLT